MLMVCKIMHCNNDILLFNSDIHFIDKDEAHNNPNSHSEEQNELELTDSKYFLKLHYTLKK